jgi:hypothetical protein
MFKNFIYSLCLLLAVTFWSCSPGLRYSAEAYQRDSTIETKVMQVIKNTSDSYSAHAAEIDAIKADIDNASSNGKVKKGKPGNRKNVGSCSAG